MGDKFFNRAKKNIINENYEKALRDLRLTKRKKDPEIILYEIVCFYFLRDIPKLYNKIKKLKEYEQNIIYNIVGAQCLHNLLEIVKKRKEVNVVYNEIIRKNKNLEINLNKKIIPNKSELRKFIKQDLEIFENIFEDSILYRGKKKKGKSKIIDLIKKDKYSYESKLITNLTKSNIVDRCILYYYLDKFGEFLESYKKIEDDERFICKTLYGVVLFKQSHSNRKKIKEAADILYSVFKLDEDENILALKYYLKSLFKLGSKKKILAMEKEINSYKIYQEYLFYVKASQLNKLKEYDSSINYIDKGLNIVPNDVKLNLLKVKILIYYKSDFSGAIKILDNLAMFLKKTESNKKEFIEFCEKLLKRLNQRYHKSGEISNKVFGKQLMVCNILLKVNPHNLEIKKKKIELIDTFLGKKEFSEKLTLNHLITEVRLTEDVGYLKVMARRYFNRQRWERALYCIEAILAYEPGDKEMLDIKEKALSVARYDDSEELDYIEPNGEIILVDTNIWISKIQHSVNTTAGEYFFTNLKEGNLEKAFARLTDSNDLTLSPTIMLELNLFLKNLEKSYLKDIMDTKFSRRYKEIREKLTKRKKDYMRRYGNFLDISLPYDNLNTIRNFYHYRLRELEKITKVKIYSKTPYNTIKKLVQREGYLPEVNDRKLLSEAIWIQKNTDKQVGILSGDKDFTSFAGDIYKRFKIKIYNAYTIGERIGKKGR